MLSCLSEHTHLATHLLLSEAALMEAGADEGSSSMKVLSVVTVQTTVLRMI